jgi:CRP-like cAMP-binding protein
VILDFKRVNEIDSTGAKILLQIHDRMLKEGKFPACLLQGRAALTNLLRDMGVIAAATHDRIFADTDHAVEWAEDHLILGFLGDIEAGAEFPFGQLDVLAQMNEEELAVVRKVLSRRLFGKGALVFLEGDQSDELYIIAKGSASVGLKLPGDDRETRLATFAPGTMFGEIALLDRAPRSATVRADEPLVCYC